jgi:hypothetical protein
MEIMLLRGIKFMPSGSGNEFHKTKITILNVIFTLISKIKDNYIIRKNLVIGYFSPFLMKEGPAIR